MQEICHGSNSPVARLDTVRCIDREFSIHMFAKPAHPAMTVLRRHNVTVRGNPQAARTMVFVHGFGTDQTAWTAVAAAFADDYRIVTFDNAGAGQADPAAFVQHRYLSLDGYASDLLEICGALQLRDAVLVGHSVGAMIGVLAAIRQPECFARLALIAASPRYLDAEGYHGGMTEQDLDRVYGAVVENFPGWVEAVAPHFMDNPERPELATRFADSLRSIPPERALTVLCSILQSDYRAELPKLRQPTLVLQTSTDVFVPLGVADYLQRHIPHATLRMIAARGHFPHVSEPALVSAALREFLAAPDT